LPVSCENKSTTTHSTQFMVHTEEGSVPYLYSKFEGIAQFVQKLLRGSQSQKLEVGSHDPGDAQLGLVIWSLCLYRN